MASTGIVLTPKAEEDLRQIFDYLSEYSFEAALLQIERILDKTEILLQFPRLGKVIPELNNNQCRELLIGNYQIAYYIVSDERIDILSIHHSGRPR